MAHVLRARPRPHPPRAGVPPAGRQDAGVRVPRRPPAHSPHARPRGRPGRHVGGPHARPERRPHRGDRPRPRLRPRPGWPRQRGRPVAVRARRLRPRRLGRRRDADPAEPVRGDARRHPQPLVEPSGTRHAGGRGRVVGRPHRLRVPRLRGRCGGGHRRRRHAAGDRRRALRAVAFTAVGHVHPGDGRRHRADRADRDDRSGRRGAGRVPPLQLRGGVPASGQPRSGRSGRRPAARARRALRRSAPVAARSPARLRVDPTPRSPLPCPTSPA